jgi:putative phosphoribosyl transferase
MLYCNRAHAGEELAAALRQRSFERPLVLGISRGGVPVAIPVARALGAELGFLAATKLRAPWNPEVSIGAITADGFSYVEGAVAANPGVGKAYLETEKAKQMSLARQRAKRFGATRGTLKGRFVVLVDDGIASGATAIAAIRSCRLSGASWVILAIPVALPSALYRARREADELLCLKEDAQLFAVGEAYGDFQPVEDAEVDAILRSFRRTNQASCAPSRRGGSPHLTDPVAFWGGSPRRPIDWFERAAQEEDLC